MCRFPAFPSTTVSGSFVGYRGVGRNITPLKRAEAEHRAHLWFLESMDRINRAIQGTADLDRMMGDFLEAALDIFNCDRAWIVYPCDPCAPSWRVVTEKAKPEVAGVFAQGTDIPVDAAKAAIFSAALETPGPIPAGPAYQLDIPALIAERFRIGSQMAMAVHAKADKPFLFALHQCAQKREWSAPEQRLFQEVGRRLGDGMAALSMLRNLGESKRKLDAAQRIAHLGWWERDFATQRVSLSEEVQRIFGVPPVPLPGWQERWTNLIHPEDRARTTEAAAAAARGGPRYDVEYRVVRPDGSVRVVHSEGDVIYDDAGRPQRQFGVLQDITQLRQSERELSEIKERFRVLAESALTGIYLTEQDRFTYVNPALAKMFGYEVEEVVGRRSIDLTCPDDRPLVDQNMRRRLQGAVEEVRYEFRGLRKDGSVFPVEVHGRRIEHAGRIGVLGTLIDNTERRRAEDDLRASEARFRTFVDHARDGFLLMDEQLTVVDVNRQACESLGYRREELIGMHPRDFDAGLDDPAIARLAQRAGAGETLTFETVHRRKDGALLPVEIRVGHFMQGGQPFHLALVRDISERKRVEAELRASEAYLEEAQRLSHTGSWAFDLASNKYIYKSEESDRIYGFDPKGDGPTREAVLGRIHPEDRSSWERNLEKSLREKVDTSDEYRIVLPDGALRHIRAIRHPVLNSAGDVVQLVGTSIDITERKQAEEALRESERELRARQELLDLAQKAARAVAFDWHIGARERENRWSPELEAMYGLEPGTFDGTYQGWRKLLHPDDWPKVKAAIERAPASGDVTAEYRVVHQDGMVHWLRAKGRMFCDAAGQPVRMVGFMFDVTDTRHAEEALRASEERFRRLTDLSADWYWRQDENLRFTYAADEKVGYSTPVSLGKTRWELPVTPLSASWDEHRAVLAARQPFRDFQYSRIDPDGGTRYISVSGVPMFDERGAFKGYDGVASDITPRKRAEEALRASEERFRTVFDRAMDAFFVFDTQLRVVDVNRQACEALGYSREELMGMHPRQFDAGLDERSIELLAHRAGAGETITFETVHRRRDGTVFPVEVRSGAFHQGEQLLYLALARDISERKHAEMALRASEARFRTFVDRATDAFFLLDHSDHRRGRQPPGMRKHGLQPGGTGRHASPAVRRGAGRTRPPAGGGTGRRG